MADRLTPAEARALQPDTPFDVDAYMENLRAPLKERLAIEFQRGVRAEREATSAKMTELQNKASSLGAAFVLLGFWLIGRLEATDGDE